VIIHAIESFVGIHKPVKHQAIADRVRYGSLSKLKCVRLASNDVKGGGEGWTGAEFMWSHTNAGRMVWSTIITVHLETSNDVGT